MRKQNLNLKTPFFYSSLLLGLNCTPNFLCLLLLWKIKSSFIFSGHVYSLRPVTFGFKFNNIPNCSGSFDLLCKKLANIS